jgi:hypothetical protein
MVSISEGQTLRSDGGQGWRFRQPETVVYRRILQQAGWNGDGFCIPPPVRSLVAFATGRAQIRSQEPV